VAQKQNVEMMSLSQKSYHPIRIKGLISDRLKWTQRIRCLTWNQSKAEGPGSGPVPLIISSVILTLVPRKGVRFRLSAQSSREFMIAVYKNGLQLKLNSDPFPTYSCVTVHDTLSNWIEFSIP